MSSLNHHISVLKLRVHSAYLHYLQTSELPDGVDQSWSNPTIYRSKWFDLFDVDDRLEALRLVWGIMGYLARSDVSTET